MPRPRLVTIAVCAAAALPFAACGSSDADNPAPAASVPTASPASIPATAALAGPRLLDWPQFGLDAQRSGVSERPTGITATNVAHLRHITVSLPGTVDSSPIYLHGVSVDGASHDVVIVTTTYGKTVTIDAASGHLLWTFTPAGYGSVAGSAQITTGTPLAD